MFHISVPFVFRTCKIQHLVIEQVLALVQVIMIVHVIGVLSLHILLWECIASLIKAKPLVVYRDQYGLFSHIIVTDAGHLLCFHGKVILKILICSYHFEVWAHEF